MRRWNELTDDEKAKYRSVCISTVSFGTDFDNAVEISSRPPAPKKRKYAVVKTHKLHCIAYDDRLYPVEGDASRYCDGKGYAIEAAIVERNPEWFEIHKETEHDMSRYIGQPMDISEVRERKHILEEQISRLLQAFEAETGCAVGAIIEADDTGDAKHYQCMVWID